MEEQLVLTQGSLVPDHLQKPSVENTVAFMGLLEALRKTISPDEWKRAIKEDYRLASWRYFLTLDPYTKWGLLKPRGYAGDATLMDFAYRHKTISHHIENAGDKGQAIYELRFRSSRKPINNA